MIASRIKYLFFDTPKVIAALSKTERKVMSKFGSYVRRTARQSLKYGETSSPPGRPPTVHRAMNRTTTNKKTGVTKTQSVSPLREFLYFSFDPAAHSVVVGPARYDNTRSENIGVLERGGTVQVRQVWSERRKQWVPCGARALGKTRILTMNIAPHPFMAPALAVNQPALPGLWKDSIK